MRLFAYDAKFSKKILSSQIYTNRINELFCYCLHSVQYKPKVVQSLAQYQLSYCQALYYWVSSYLTKSPPKKKQIEKVMPHDSRKFQNILGNFNGNFFCVSIHWIEKSVVVCEIWQRLIGFWIAPPERNNIPSLIFKGLSLPVRQYDVFDRLFKWSNL